eukprot:184693-Rhodomonas_salina.1
MMFPSSAAAATLHTLSSSDSESVPDFGRAAPRYARAGCYFYLPIEVTLMWRALTGCVRTACRPTPGASAAGGHDRGHAESHRGAAYFVDLLFRGVAEDGAMDAALVALRVGQRVLRRYFKFK